MRRFTYALRCVVQPGFQEEERLAKIIRFALRGKMDEIMFFVNCEDLNDGHLTPEETGKWVDTLRRCKRACTAAGIRFSINPWTTLLHADRGRRLKEGQNFATMADMDGLYADAVACPLDETFLDYIEKTYARYAVLEPNTLWIEDDFRLHGHAPLRWGGCFCEKHMQRYCGRLGRRVSREEFYQRLLTGEDDCRKAWMDVSRETMVALAERISRGTHSVSPGTRMALMCSNPIVHAAEGRDWYGILDAMGDGAVVRPHLPAYEEIAAKDYLWHFCCASRLTAAVTEKRPISLWPELDNFPYSRFSKSHRFSRMQVLMSLGLNADGITMNIVDMIGNGVSDTETMDQMLTQIKPFLERFSGKLPVTAQQGILIPVCETSGYTLRPHKPQDMTDLYLGETYFASLLSAYGIANRMVPDFPQGKGQAIAISGQYLRNFDREQICSLFAGNTLLLDGEAALTLFDMGLGHLAGIESAFVEEREDRAYEEFTGLEMLGVSSPRITAQHYTCGKYVSIGYSPEARILSGLYTYKGERMGNGMARFCNVMILPQMSGYRHSYQHLNPFAMEAVKQFLRGRVPMLEDCCDTMLLSYKLEEGRALLVANCTTDDIPCLVISGLEANSARCFSTDVPEGCSITAIRSSAGVLTLEEPLKAMDVKVFILDSDQ